VTDIARHGISDPDPICDLPSIAAARKRLFWRWLWPFLSLTVQVIMAADALALILYWLIAWGTPGVSRVSLTIFLVVGAVCALLICAPHFARMLWLDFRINRRLSEMTRRVAAGETVRASELRSGLR
jgi:uncharacterized membrane protein YciS (DUF1049 family)